jgi:hypothetical protein
MFTVTGQPTAARQDADHVQPHRMMISTPPSTAQPVATANGVAPDRGRMLNAERSFRRIKGYKQMPQLVAASSDTPRRHRNGAAAQSPPWIVTQFHATRHARFGRFRCD